VTLNVFNATLMVGTLWH